MQLLAVLITLLSVFGCNLSKSASTVCVQDGQRSKRSTSSQEKDHSTGYVMISRQLDLECFANQSKKKKLVDPSYTWTNEKNSVLKDGRFQSSEDKLRVIDVQPKDEGIYSCTVKHKYDTDVFKHLIKVYVIPNFQYDVKLFYLTSLCSKSIRNNQLEKVKMGLCPNDNCPIKHFSSICHVVQGAKKKHEIWISFSVVHDENLRLPICDSVCMEKFVMGDLNSKLPIVNEFVDKEKNSKHKNVHLKTEYPLKSILMKKCPHGFRKEGMLCRPCKPGTFSKETDKACDPCPEGTYQPAYAMKECYPCDNGISTREMGSKSKKQCVVSNLEMTVDEGPVTMITALSVTAVLLFIITVVGGSWLKIYLNAIAKDPSENFVKGLSYPIDKEDSDEDDEDDDEEENEDDVLLPQKVEGKGWVVSNPKSSVPPGTLDLQSVFHGNAGPNENKAPSDDIYMEPYLRGPTQNYQSTNNYVDEPIYDTADPPFMTNPDYKNVHGYWDHQSNDPSIPQAIHSHPPPQILPGLLSLENLGPPPKIPQTKGRTGPLPPIPGTSQDKLISTKF